MDIALHIKAALMGLVEGLTEFLPVSSTGHLIVAGSFLKFDIPGKAAFMIAIQTAAILAVCWEYRARLLHILFNLHKDRREQRLVRNVCTAFVPAAFLGVLFGDLIEAALFSPVPVAAAFIAGGLVILWIERRIRTKGHEPRVAAIDDITWKDALKVGALQCFALIPGTSRSGATIIGGMVAGLSRRAATEFSFFLAMPTIFGATAWSLYKARDSLVLEGLSLYMTASVTAFISAFVCVRWLLKYVSTHDFRVFAWYRMVFGVIILMANWS